MWREPTILLISSLFLKRFLLRWRLMRRDGKNKGLLVFPTGTARCSGKLLSKSSPQVPKWPLRRTIMKRRGHPGLFILDGMRSDESACILESLSQRSCHKTTGLVIEWASNGKLRIWRTIFLIVQGRSSQGGAEEDCLYRLADIREPGSTGEWCGTSDRQSSSTKSISLPVSRGDSGSSQTNKTI